MNSLNNLVKHLARRKSEILASLLLISGLQTAHAQVSVEIHTQSGLVFRGNTATLKDFNRLLNRSRPANNLTQVFAQSASSARPVTKVIIHPNQQVSAFQRVFDGAWKLEESRFESMRQYNAQFKDTEFEIHEISSLNLDREKSSKESVQAVDKKTSEVSSQEKLGIIFERYSVSAEGEVVASLSLGDARHAEDMLEAMDSVEKTKQIQIEKISPLFEAPRRTILNSNYKVENGLVKVAFFDADSTLRVAKSGSVSANGPQDVEVLPFVADKIAKLAREGYLIAIVSNQGGIEAGVVTHETAASALRYMMEQIKSQNRDAIVHAFDYAEGSDRFRKPELGMAEALSEQLAKRNQKIDWANSFMVGDSAYKKGKTVKDKDGSVKELPGDTTPEGKPGKHFSNSDRLFAVNIQKTYSASFAFHEPYTFFGWDKYGVDLFESIKDVEEFYKKHPTVKRASSFKTNEAAVKCSIAVGG